MSIRLLPVFALLLAALVGLGASAAVLAGPKEPTSGFPEYVTGRRNLKVTCTVNNCGLINGCPSGNCCCTGGGSAWQTPNGCNYCCGAGDVGCHVTNTDHSCYTGVCPGSAIVDGASAAGKTVTDTASSGLDALSGVFKTWGGK